MRRIYYWTIFGTIGFLLGQGVVVMWPEWSPWAWWALAAAMLPLLAVPTIWDRRHRLASRLRFRPFRRRNYDRIIADMHNLLAELDSQPADFHGQYRKMNRISMLFDKYPEWFPEDIDIRDARDNVHSILGSIERQRNDVSR